MVNYNIRFTNMKLSHYWNLFGLLVSLTHLANGQVVFDFQGTSCESQDITLGCTISSFTTDAIWKRGNGSVLAVTCSSAGPCSQVSQNIDGTTYSFQGNTSGIYMSTTLPPSEHGVNWTCTYSGTDYIYQFELGCSPSGGSSEPWWIVLIVLFIVCIIILVCCLFNTRCRFRYLLANCTCTCPKKDTIVIRKKLPEKRVSRSIGDDIEIQFLDGQNGEFDNLPCDKDSLKKPCRLFNPYIEIHSLKKSHAGKYTMTKDDDKWQLELTVTEETKIKDNSRNEKIGVSASQPRQNAKKTLDPLGNDEGVN